MSEVLDVAKKDGRWTECPSCAEISLTRKLEENLKVCPHCDFHFRLRPEERIAQLCDPESWQLVPVTDASGLPVQDEAIQGGLAAIEGQACVLGIMNFAHRGGTMGEALGQVLLNLLEEARDRNLPCVLFTASGGVRVQEGIWGLFQMLRTAHLRELSRSTPFVTVYTDPTLGGVTASFAGLSDIRLAEPGARIGFAGPRVIKSTLGSELPPDFQQASRLLKHGALDAVVSRHQLRSTLGYLLKWF